MGSGGQCFTERAGADAGQPGAHNADSGAPSKPCQLSGECRYVRRCTNRCASVHPPRTSGHPEFRSFGLLGRWTSEGKTRR